MSECKHCEHLTAYWEDTAGKHDRWQCCHCGRIREHGPFLDHDYAASDCLDDRDVPAFLRPQAG